MEIAINSLKTDMATGQIVTGTISWTDLYYFSEGKYFRHNLYQGDFNGDGKTDLLERYDDAENNGHLSILTYDEVKKNLQRDGPEFRQ